MNLTIPQELIIAKAIEKYGIEPQIDVCIEEMSELIKELCKYKRGKPNSISNIKEEIADVYIMLRQMKMMFDLSSEDKIQSHIDFKVNRLEERLRS